jgi:predicted  nucleic acid-binding Zn-ribbon protein
MKPSILIVMLDFLVCSLLLFVIGTGGQRTQFATSAPPAVHEEFSPAAMQAQQEEWNRDYEQQTLLAQLKSETAEKEQLQARLNETSTALAAREANLKALSEEKARVEQAKSQTEQALTSVETQLGRVNTERAKLQQEGEAAKENLAKLQTELTGLQAQQSKLQQERAELAQHAEQLGQTVASQQATINTLSEGVRASQSRMEAQMTDVAHGQQEMNSTLTQLDAFARTLPATMQQNVAGVHDEQQALQQNVADLAQNVKDLQAGLSADDKARLMQAVADVAKGQQDLQSRMDTLIKAGQNNQFGQSLSAIEAGQDALREQATKLGDQIESIKARGPGPFKAVKAARLELLVALAKVDARDGTYRFQSASYPPVVNVDGHSFIVANSQKLGLTWWGARDENEFTQVKYTVNRTADPAWSNALTEACVLQADPHVVAIEVTQSAPGLKTMELAGPEAPLQTDQRKLQIFKSTAAGLSFDADTSPDLSDSRYLVVKRQLRGVAGWFENPAYRAAVGDYVVTADGKLVGIMVTAEKCFVLSKENIANCAVSLPLADRQQFQRAVQHYPRS